jgi:hypothetical protein
MGTASVKGLGARENEQRIQRPVCGTYNIFPTYVYRLCSQLLDTSSISQPATQVSCIVSSSSLTAKANFKLYYPVLLTLWSRLVGQYCRS